MLGEVSPLQGQHLSNSQYYYCYGPISIFKTQRAYKNKRKMSNYLRNITSICAILCLILMSLFIPYI